MGYYQDISAPGQTWAHRAAISVVHTSGLATTDVQIDIPQNWDHFWSKVRADGYDIRLTAADGETALNYERVTFNQTTRTCRIEIDDVDLATDSRVYLLWVYWGNDAAADVSAAFALGAFSTGHIELGRPALAFSATLRSEDFGAVRPRRRIQKGAIEAVYVAIDVRQQLQGRDRASQRSRLFEEIFNARVRVFAASVEQVAMVDGTKQRFVETQGRTGRQMWILAFVEAGTTDTDYRILVEIQTHVPPETSHRILEPRILLRVFDTQEV